MQLEIHFGAWFIEKYYFQGCLNQRYLWKSHSISFLFKNHFFLWRWWNTTDRFFFIKKSKFWKFCWWISQNVVSKTIHMVQKYSIIVSTSILHEIWIEYCLWESSTSSIMSVTSLECGVLRKTSKIRVTFSQTLWWDNRHLEISSLSTIYFDSFSKGLYI